MSIRQNRLTIGKVRGFWEKLSYFEFGATNHEFHINEFILGEKMATQQAVEIRLDTEGEPDVACYINWAHLERADALHGWAREFARWLGGLLHSLRLEFHHPAPHG